MQTSITKLCSSLSALEVRSGAGGCYVKVRELVELSRNGSVMDGWMDGWMGGWMMDGSWRPCRACRHSLGSQSSRFETTYYRLTHSV